MVVGSYRLSSSSELRAEESRTGRIVVFLLQHISSFVSLHHIFIH